MKRVASLGAVGAALRDALAVEFVRDVVREGYRENFPDHVAPADALVLEAFASLVASQVSGVDPTALEETSRHLRRGAYHSGQSDFWFNALYHQYKTATKPDEDARQLRALISGNRVLDYGCGSGYLAARLASGGYDVYTTDVLDYRYNEARHLPFVRMTSPAELEYPEDSIDTALVQAVLHHIDPPDLGPTLSGLHRVATHLLIKEDTYGLLEGLPGLDALLASQPLLDAFTQLSLETQFSALILIDYYANAVALGIPEMNMPFQFKSPSEWEATLTASGWRVTRSVLAGFEPGRMHKSCHIWLLCERGSSA